MRSYGHLELTASSPQPAFQEPIGIDEAKTFLRCQTANNDEDYLIAGYIAAARVKAEEEQGRDLVVKQYDLWLDSFCGDIQLRTPLQSVDLVRYTDNLAVASDLAVDAYAVDLARGLLTPTSGGSWPSFSPGPSSSVLIRFQSGYPPSHPFWMHAGALLKQAMVFMVTDMYWARMVITDWEPRIISMLRHGAVPRVI